MAIPLIDNLQINSNIPIDSRIVASSSVQRDAIEYKYDGLKVFQLDTRTTYTWNLNSFTSSGITANSWDIGESGIGNINGYGSPNYIPKWDSTNSGLTSTSIISVPTNIYEVSQKVGIGGTPSEAFQVNTNYLNSVIGGTSAPFVVHKGISTIIGENWYYDISTNQGFNFNNSLGSSTITFNKGGFSFKGRIPNSSNIMLDLLDINTDASVNFNNYISMTGSNQPSYNNGSLYFDSSTNRWKVMEQNGQSRFISKEFNIYTTILSQTGTSSPTETLLESTIGSGTWSYVGVGTYNLTTNGAFSGNAPQINGFCGPYTSTNVYFGTKINNNVYQIKTVSSAGSGTFSGINLDNCLNSTLIEIKIF